MTKNIIEIWAPRYMDSTVLIAIKKVVPGKNYVKFTKAAHLQGLYEVDSDIIKSSPKQKNTTKLGKFIEVCIVPLDKLVKVS